MPKSFDLVLISITAIIFLMPVLFPNVLIQPTGSLARGLYLKQKLSTKLNREALVLVSFKDIVGRPNVYPLPQILPRMNYIKIVTGVPGDTINISDTGLYINGKYKGPVHRVNSDGKPLNRTIDGEFQLHHNWYFVTTPHPRSFDSRYWGPVHINQLQGAAPLILLPW